MAYRRRTATLLQCRHALRRPGQLAQTLRPVPPPRCMARRLGPAVPVASTPRPHRRLCTRCIREAHVLKSRQAHAKPTVADPWRLYASHRKAPAALQTGPARLRRMRSHSRAPRHAILSVDGCLLVVLRRPWVPLPLCLRQRPRSTRLFSAVPVTFGTSGRQLHSARTWEQATRPQAHRGSGNASPKNSPRKRSRICARTARWNRPRSSRSPGQRGSPPQ